MAVINLSITIADPEVPRIITACKAVWGPQMTDVEIVERLRQQVITTVKAVVFDHERNTAVNTAMNAAYVVDIT